MMTDDSPTIAAIFRLTSNSDDALAKLEATRRLLSLRKQLPRHLPAAFWPTVLAQIGAQVRAALDIPLSTVLASAWHEYGAFFKYRDPVRYPANEDILVSLAEHTITTTLTPSIGIAVNDQPVGSIELEVALEIELKGGIATLRAQRIRSLRLGSGRVTGRVRCEGVEILVRESEPYNIPGELNFPEGIPIVPHAGRPSTDPRPGPAAS